MKIYTKTGDDGSTALFDGTRVAKDDLRVDTYGDVDELNGCLGIVVAYIKDESIKNILLQIQRDLFALGAGLANPAHKKQKQKANFSSDKITFLEKAIDDCEAQIDPIKNFILPGGSLPGSFLDYARSVCRRAERKVVTLTKNASVDRVVQIYLNRLSDFLFMLARVVNKKEKIRDIPWEG